MEPITRPGDHHESWGSFYDRGLFRGKPNRSTRPDRGLAYPSVAVVETCFAVGHTHRGDDAPLAPARQKRRWGAGLALGCLLVCALGRADAHQGLRFAPDGSLRGRERGGARLHWTSARSSGADARPFQHRPSLRGSGQGGNRRGQPPGDQGGAPLWLCRRGQSVDRYHGPGVAHWLSQRTGYFAGAGPTLWPGLDPDATARDCGTRQGSGSGADDLALRQRTPSFYLGQSGQTPGVDPDIARGRRADGANASAAPASGDKFGRGDAACARAADGDARGDQATDGSDCALDFDGQGGGEQNRACGDSPSPRHRAEQGGQEDGVWLGLSDQPLGRRLCVGGADRCQCGRATDAAQGTGGVSGDLWSRGDAGVGGLRPGGRLNPAPPAARVGRGQGCGHSAQGESAVVGCRGSPRSDSQRAGSDRGQHWDFEKQSIQVQQTEGASLAHAGDGGAEVYPLVQSEQIHAGFSGADPVRDRQQRLERNPNRERVQSQQEGMEARMTSNGILRHALNNTVLLKRFCRGYIKLQSHIEHSIEWEFAFLKCLIIVKIPMRRDYEAKWEVFPFIHG